MTTELLPWSETGAFPLYLAPMAGYTDIVYRQLCKEEGADILVSEFVMSDAVILDHPKVWETLDFTEAQRPMGIQIFGYDFSAMAQAAQIIEARSAPDFIDLNFGCPSEKVTCQQAGASLLKEPSRLIQMAQAVVKAVPNTPVTAKIRLGWDAANLVAHDIAKGLEQVGVRALTIHGRTKVQGYSGEADWDHIRSVAESVDLPVIGNGSIQNSAQVYALQHHSRVRGVMIGRAALGYPWIFREIKEHLRTGERPPPPSLELRWQTLLRYANLLAARKMRQHEEGSITWMRSKLLKLTKDMPGCKKLRAEMNHIQKLEDIAPIAERHLERYRGLVLEHKDFNQHNGPAS
ncbi:MAG: tRNA dihydrouridine synthase DusB [Puniceicoccaceae bacterium]